MNLKCFPLIWSWILIILLKIIRMLSSNSILRLNSSKSKTGHMNSITSPYYFKYFQSSAICSMISRHLKKYSLPIILFYIDCLEDSQNSLISLRITFPIRSFSLLIGRCQSISLTIFLISFKILKLLVSRTRHSRFSQISFPNPSLKQFQNSITLHIDVASALSRFSSAKIKNLCPSEGSF